MDSIDCGQEPMTALSIAEMNLPFSYKTGYLSTNCGTLCISETVLLRGIRLWLLTWLVGWLVIYMIMQHLAQSYSEILSIVTKQEFIPVLTEQVD